MGDLVRNATYKMGVPVIVKTEVSTGTAMTLTGAADREVDVAGSGDVVIGHLYTAPLDFPGDGVVITGYSEEREALFEGTVAPGDFVKIGTPDNGTQRYSKFTPGTDGWELCTGLCIEGGTGSTGRILTS